MTVIVPDNYHARDILIENRITCISKKNALRQDIREMRIGILQLGEFSQEEQLNLLRPLGMSIIQVLPLFLALEEAQPEHGTISIQDIIGKDKLDGLILVGTALKWPSIDCELLNDLLAQISCSILGIGSGGLHLLHRVGIEIEKLEQIEIDVLPGTNSSLFHPVTGEMDDYFLCPKVRKYSPSHFSLLQQIEQQHIHCLAQWENGDPMILETANHQSVMHLGHPEFLPTRLLHYLHEYPHNQTQFDFDKENPINLWRAHRNDFFSQWLKYCYNCMNKV